MYVGALHDVQGKGASKNHLPIRRCVQRGSSSRNLAIARKNDH